MFSKDVAFSSLFLLIIISMLLNVASVDMECEFKDADFGFPSLKFKYSCVVHNYLMIYDPNTAIDSVRGTHQAQKSNDDVERILITDKKTQYMPTNLGEIFKNLNFIRLRYGRLKVIRQSDLKAFTELRYLHLGENDIETLDDDLFEFNPLLEVIWVNFNKIKAIGGSTFEQLTKLRDLDLGGNICIASWAHSDQIQNLKSEIKQKCLDELSIHKKEVKELSELNEELMAEIEKLEVEILQSKKFEDEKNSSNKFPTTLIVIGLALIVLLIVGNIVFALRFYRPKTVVLKPVELELEN